MPRRKKSIAPAECSLDRQMHKFRSNETVESDDDDVFNECLFRRSFPVGREHYLRDNWAFIRKHLATYNLQVRVKFERRLIAMDVVRKTRNVMFVLRGRYLLKLMTFNIPYQYSVRILRDNVHVAFIKATAMFENRDAYYRRRHRLLEPDIRTLTYIELFTDCNVLLDRKTIILLGAYKGVKRASRIVWDTIEGNYHPIDRLKQLMIRHVQRRKRPKVNFDDWDDFLSKFPRVATPAVECDDRNASSESPAISPTHIQENLFIFTG